MGTDRCVSRIGWRDPACELGDSSPHLGLSFDSILPIYPEVQGSQMSEELRQVA